MRKDVINIIPFMSDIENLKSQIINLYNPKFIYLFGSCARECAREDSDIDLCIILNYDDKKKILRDMNSNLEFDRDVDIVVYTPSKWEEYIKDTSTFANLILRTGVKIYG